MRGVWLGGCAALVTGIGVHLKGRGGLAMHALPDGSLLYPQSAGSDDAALVSAALLCFALTACAALLAVIFPRLLPLAWGAYGLNLVLLAVVVGLVSLDSSLLDAALLGDGWPLAGVLLALAPLLVCCLRCLTALGKYGLVGARGKP